MRSEKMTSRGCPSNPAGAALLLPQPTSRNQLDTPSVDLGLGGTRCDGGTSTGASQEVNTAAVRPFCPQPRDSSSFLSAQQSLPCGWGIPKHRHTPLTLCQCFSVTLSCRLLSFLVSRTLVEGFLKSP